MIILDGIIFSLQEAGGVSTYFRELATRFLQMPLGEVERIEPAALRAA